MSATAHCFKAYFEAWNTQDEGTMRSLANEVLTTDLVFCDPNHDIRGREAFATMVQEFKKKYPGSKVVRTSEVDLHHDRARYSWTIIGQNGGRFDGFDSVRLDVATGKIARIDGFFGPLKML